MAKEFVGGMENALNPPLVSSNLTEFEQELSKLANIDEELAEELYKATETAFREFKENF